MNKKGQMMFIGLIFLIIALFIFFFALPMISEAVGVGVNNSGSVAGFVIKLFPWIILLLLVWGGIRLMRS